MNSIYASEQLKQVIWQDFITHFKSISSIVSYQSDIDEYLNYIQKDFLLQNSTDAENFYAHLIQKSDAGKIKPNTIAKKIRELHSFATYICENRENYQIPKSFKDEFLPYLGYLAKLEKYAKSVPIEHIDRMMKAAQDDLMAYCIITLLYRVGLSSTEIVELKLAHFEAYDNGVYAFVPGRKEASYIPEDVYLILERYLAAREEHEYLFYNSRRNKLNIKYISRMIKKYAQLAGVPAYSAETLRNSCAFTMFTYDANPEQVAKQMGVTQTMIKRYQSRVYKDNVLKNANQLIKIKVELPDDCI
uniref:tyrosine-type recombinase/integrase n=1 Tax=Agathobacter sp. TaxID=2021311 RepID=UPI004056C3DA